MNEIISIKRLSKSYGGLSAVRDLNLSVMQGTIFGLLGANGAGKSSTIECMLGTKKPDTGTVSILGMNPFRQRKQLFENVGVQFQEANYQDKVTVVELCQVTQSLYRHAADYEELLKKFGISDKAKSMVKELSGGQRQKLFIVLALIPQPKVVFLDELTTGLDAKARREVWKILSDLKGKGLTIFLTSHFMDEVETLCDEICILQKGRAVFYGTVTQAKENLDDLNERGTDAVGGKVLEFMESILTPDEIAESELRVSIIRELIKARQEKGISQKKLEELSGVKQPVIARMEKGSTSPQLDTILKVLAPLGKTLAVVPLETGSR